MTAYPSSMNAFEQPGVFLADHKSDLVTFDGKTMIILLVRGNLKSFVNH